MVLGLVILGHDIIELLEVKSFVVIGFVTDENRVKQFQNLIIVNRISGHF